MTNITIGTILAHLTRRTLYYTLAEGVSELKGGVGRAYTHSRGSTENLASLFYCYLPCTS